MGLGKTLQVVALVHTLIAHQELTKTKRVLIILPKNGLSNWMNEFKSWTKNCKHKVPIQTFPHYPVTKQHLECLEKWHERGGVFLMSFNIFTRLISNKNHPDLFEKYLIQPGADLVCFDEGHILKSEATNISKSLAIVSTSRRIVTTGKYNQLRKLL